MYNLAKFGYILLMSKKQRAELDKAFSDATRVQRMTAAEASTLPGMLGRIASPMLAARGWYGFRSGDERVLLIRPDVERDLLS